MDILTSKYFLEIKEGTIIERTIFATEEQEAIIDEALNGKENLLINALAGAAKTSTLQFLCKYLPVQPTLSLAFNKRIAEEMTKRLPGHIKCQTLNSVGHRVWGTACAHKLQVETKKSYMILKEIVDNLPRRDRSEAYDTFSDTLKLVARAKAAGYIPDGIFPHAKRLTSTQDFWQIAEEEDEELSLSRVLVDQTLEESIKRAYKGLIDFDDQLYMSTLFGGSFPQFPLVMVDEAQDLSRLNHEMLKKLARQRLIAVGDPWQSIYGFRGAVSKGMDYLKTDFQMKEMGLSVSFRCPKKIVENAWFRAPHMKWAEAAAEGSITVKEKWYAADIPDEAAIICRNNAPLFSLAFKLLRNSRGVRLVGFDIGPSLVKSFRKLGAPGLDQEGVYRAISLWESEERQKGKKKLSAIQDRADCFRVFAGFDTTLETAAKYAEHMFATTGTISLLSGHKSKGLEWDVVFHLDPWRIPSPFASSDEEAEQELNVRYVIETRAKKDLFLVNMKDFDAQ